MNPEQVESDVQLEFQTHRAVQEHPWWFTLMGTGLIALGIVAMVASFVTTMATVLFFGGLLLLGGLAQIVDAFSSRDAGGVGPRLLAGVLYAAVGGLLVFDPVSGAIGLTLLLAAFFFVAGVARLFLASRWKGRAWSWLAASGVIDILLGVLIWVQWPATGIWVIGLFVGIEMLLCGIAMLLFTAQMGRRHLDRI